MVRYRTGTCTNAPGGGGTSSHGKKEYLLQFPGQRTHMSWVSLPLAAAPESETVVAGVWISRAGVRGNLTLSLGERKIAKEAIKYYFEFMFVII